MAWQKLMLDKDGHLVIWTSWRLIERIERRCGNKNPIECNWGIFTDGAAFVVQSADNKEGWGEAEEFGSLEAARAEVDRQAEHLDKILRDTGE